MNAISTSEERVPARERLRHVARQVLDHGGTWDESKDLFFRMVRGDAGLLWVLLEPYRVQAMQEVLRKEAGRTGQGPGPAPRSLRFMRGEG